MMKALVKQQAGPGVSLISCPVPQVGQGEVLINVLKTSLCNTDLSLLLMAEWKRFIEGHCPENSLCFIGQITPCEIARVLESNYGQDRADSTEVIEGLLQVGQLEVMEPGVVWKVLRDYQNSNAGFPDHLLARVNESAGCEATVTFDKNTSKKTGFWAIEIRALDRWKWLMSIYLMVF